VSLELSDNEECTIKKMYDMLPKREAECHSSAPIDICSAFHAEVRFKLFDTTLHLTPFVLTALTFEKHMIVSRMLGKKYC